MALFTNGPGREGAEAPLLFLLILIIWEPTVSLRVASINCRTREKNKVKGKGASTDTDSFRNTKSENRRDSKVQYCPTVWTDEAKTPFAAKVISAWLFQSWLNLLIIGDAVHIHHVRSAAENMVVKQYGRQYRS